MHDDNNDGDEKQKPGAKKPLQFPNLPCLSVKKGAAEVLSPLYVV